MYKQLIIIMIAQCLLLSCIKENYDFCPDYGKYKVLFTSAGAETGSDIEYLSVRYNGLNVNENIVGYHDYSKVRGDSLFQSQNLLKLPQGKFSFNALISNSPIIKEEGMFKMTNGIVFLIGKTVKNIIKKKCNIIGIRLSLCNSLIQVKCNLSSSLSDEYLIENLNISAPCDSSVLLNLLSGKCNYSGRTTQKYDYFRINRSKGLYEYYTVPISSGCILNFRLTLVPKNNPVDGKENISKILTTKIHLNHNIEQGKIYLFNFDVIGPGLNHISTTVFDWENIETEGIIPFI